MILAINFPLLSASGRGLGGNHLDSQSGGPKVSPHFEREGSGFPAVPVVTRKPTSDATSSPRRESCLHGSTTNGL